MSCFGCKVCAHLGIIADFMRKAGAVGWMLH